MWGGRSTSHKSVGDWESVGPRARAALAARRVFNMICSPRPIFANHTKCVVFVPGSRFSQNQSPRVETFLMKRFGIWAIQTELGYLGASIIRDIVNR